MVSLFDKNHRASNSTTVLVSQDSWTHGNFFHQELIASLCRTSQQILGLLHIINHQKMYYQILPAVNQTRNIGITLLPNYIKSLVHHGWWNPTKPRIFHHHCSITSFITCHKNSAISLNHHTIHQLYLPELTTGWWARATPLKKYESIGMMTFPIYGKIKLMFQTTNQTTIHHQFFTLHHHPTETTGIRVWAPLQVTSHCCR